MESLSKGFRWVVGNGENISAAKDQWLRMKKDFCVENSHMYEGRNEKVSSYFLPNSKQWNVPLVVEKFLPEDAQAILAIPIPQRNVHDRLVWFDSTNGMYSAKNGYRFWQNQNLEILDIPQCQGWRRIWRLPIPHKMKIFVRRFCRNTIPVRKRLRTKGVSLPITCPMCNVDIEHLLHVFFDCYFAKQCWNHVGLNYDLNTVEFAPDWLLNKLDEVQEEEAIKISTVLWGIWLWRNRKVWEGKTISAAIAMDNSFHFVSDWRKERLKHTMKSNPPQQEKQAQILKWKPPTAGVLKINVDASFVTGSATFQVGMVLRNHQGTFLAGRNLCLKSPTSVFEAKSIGVLEALLWIKMQQLQNHKIELESDSLMVVQGINKEIVNLLEVGGVLEQCRNICNELVETSIHFVRNQANRAAHEIARIPCLVNCHNIFTSLPDCLVETVLFDSVF